MFHFLGKKRFPTSRKIKGRRKSRKKNIFFLELRISQKHLAAENMRSSRAPVSSVWHRPQCNIGPGISPVTIGTMDDDGRQRPGLPGLASYTQRRRGNDEINVRRMLGAIAAAVVVVAAVTSSSVTHTMLASDIRRSINERSRRLGWEYRCEDLDERGPDCFRRQYRMPQQTFEKTCIYTASPWPLPDRRFLARSLTR